MPTFFPAESSGANSWTERDSVLNSFKAIGSAQVKARRVKAKGEIYCGSRAGRAAAARFYGDARSLKNKILLVDNFRV